MAGECGISIGAYSQEGPQLNTQPAPGETAASNLLIIIKAIPCHCQPSSSHAHLVAHSEPSSVARGKRDHKKVEETHVFHVSDLRGHLQGLFEATWGANTVPFLPHERVRSSGRVSSCGWGIRGARNPFPHPMCHACIILYGTPAICLLLTVERISSG